MPRYRYSKLPREVYRSTAMEYGVVRRIGISQVLWLALTALCFSLDAAFIEGQYDGKLKALL